MGVVLREAPGANLLAQRESGRYGPGTSSFAGLASQTLSDNGGLDTARGQLKVMR